MKFLPIQPILLTKVSYILTKEKNQLILAFQGSTHNLRDWGGTSLPGILGNEAIIGQQRIIDEVLEEAIILAKSVDYTLSLTGHGLGGWLAQIASFIAHEEYLERVSYAKRMLKTVVFDSPGAREMFENLQYSVARVDLDRLDITNYVSTPNSINTLNRHTGTLFQVVNKELSKMPLQYDLESHSMDNFVAVFEKDTGTFRPEVAKKIRKMKSWPSQKTKGGIWKWVWDSLFGTQPSEGDPITDDIRYGIQYVVEEQGYKPYRIHKRHIPPHDYAFLSEKKAKKDRYIKVLEGTTWAKYLTIDRENRDYVILAEEAKNEISDIRIALDELHRLALANAYLMHQYKEKSMTGLFKKLNFAISPAKDPFFVGRKKEMAKLSPLF